MESELIPKAIDKHGAAKILGGAVQTLRNREHERRGPAYLKPSRAVRYRIDDIEMYLNSKRVDQEAN